MHIHIEERVGKENPYYYGPLTYNDFEEKAHTLKPNSLGLNLDFTS